MEFTQLIKSMQKNSIHITPAKDGDMDSVPVCSKIGGKPDLPPDFEWYYYRGESFDDVTKNRPLSFLAQINCEEIYEYDKDKLLPPKGMLYFFYELATMTWGIYPHDWGSARVYYYPGDVAELIKHDFPADLPDEFRLPEIPIKFSSKQDAPYFEEFVTLHGNCPYELWHDYNRAKVAMGFGSELDFEDEEIWAERDITKLLGFASLVQGEMLSDCERFIMADKFQEENIKNWQLLFQMDTVKKDGYEMLWGDVGRIYFYINTDDLAKHDFSKCWLRLQCG